MKLPKVNKKELISDFLNFCICICVGFFIFGFLLQPVVVDGISMEPTLYDNNFIIGARRMYSLERGDIAVIKTEGIPDAKFIIKRIIGMPGDLVVIDYNTNSIYVNGEKLEETYIKEPMENIDTYSFYDGRAEYEVPNNHYFVLGDNRNNSADSRYISIGYVKKSDIRAKILFGVIPFRVGL